DSGPCRLAAPVPGSPRGERLPSSEATAAAERLHYRGFRGPCLGDAVVLARPRDAPGRRCPAGLGGSVAGSIPPGFACCLVFNPAPGGDANGGLPSSLSSADRRRLPA